MTMLASARIPLGAPGVYRLPDYEAPALSAQRMDACAFVGVAPRGPAHVAVPVRSFEDYARRFGAFEGPGLLPHAVAAFFEHGGRRAYVVRITPPEGAVGATARGRIEAIFTSTLELAARDEGAWGNGLAVAVRFSLRPLAFEIAAGVPRVARRDALAPGALLLIEGAHGARVFTCVVATTERRDESEPVSQWELELDPVPGIVPLRAFVVEAQLAVIEAGIEREVHEGLGLHAMHPRYLPRALLAESSLVVPVDAEMDATLWPASAAVERLHGASPAFAQGRDRYGEILHEHFFDPDWSPVEEESGRGVAAVATLPDVTHLVVPDLYVPAQWLGRETAVDLPSGDPEFAPCVDAKVAPPASNTPPSALESLILDPRRGDDLARIGELHQALVEFCEERNALDGLIALIDVPPGLSQGQAERWRARFDTSWCAAYHPWLVPARRADDDGLARTRPLTPSAVAAGIVARKELRRGIQFGPANEIAQAIVDLAERAPADRADVFHPQGLNCFVREADGIHLVSARTLSRDPQWRQLSVRRLVLMLRRTLLRETQWAVFEPNGPALWRDLRHAIENLLRQLFRAGAFAGGTESESFFVRVRDERVLLDRGELVVEIGVAPAEPLEFILLRLRRAGDGTLSLEE